MKGAVTFFTTNFKISKIKSNLSLAKDLLLMINGMCGISLTDMSSPKVLIGTLNVCRTNDPDLFKEWDPSKSQIV